ncbi:MAG: Omp28-related outer membrane protein, partial [Candidatus Cloacimonas sp.]|nr:Omp28-related outer membrane protein [Candidatus Cloacimonas sp.]
MKKIIFLSVLVGLVTIAMALPRTLVVVEIGTGTWCQYCPGAAMGADDLIANNLPVAIVENHNGDPYANTYSNARNSYYGISGFPTAFFDGLNPSEGGSNNQSLYSNYLPKVNARMNVASHYSISATGSISGNTISIQATVNKPEADANTNVVLHCAITESHINQSWQGQSHLNFVNRLMLPNQYGSPVSLATGAQQTFTLTGDWSSTWNLNTSEVILYLQNTTTKEILQGAKYTLPGLLGVNPVSATELTFPDAYVGGSKQLPFTLNNFFSGTISGTLSSNNPVFSLPQTNFTIAPYQSITLNVDFFPTAAQTYNGSLTINSNLPGFNLVTLPMNGTGFINTPPSVTNAVITGPPVIFQELSVSYDFNDTDGNTEGTSQYQWMRIINNTPNPIDGALQPVYSVQIEDLGWKLACQVTPLDQHGMAGNAIMSAYSATIVELPSPRNLTGYLSGANSIVLNWQKPMYFDGRGFVGYRLYRNGSTLTNIMNTSNLTYTDSNIPDGTMAYYVVAIFSNPLNFSDPSNTVTITVNVASDDELAPVLASVRVYPNPFSSVINFEIASKLNNPT